jgi:tRNA A-37 threonylcarbamoyl transferase component Bud32
MAVVSPGIISIEPDRVVKRGAPALLRIEAEKTRQAQRIGERSGLFRAPRVLALDEEAGRLELERIEGIAPLIARLRSRSESGALLARLGRSLAALHADMVLPDEMTLPLPADWSSRHGEDVVIHGDLSVQNVQLCAGDESIAILDFSMSPWLALPGTVGDSLIDLSWFGRNLFMCARPLSTSRSRIENAFLLFLGGYLRTRPMSAGAGELAAELAALNDRLTRRVQSRVRLPGWRKWWYDHRIERYAAFLRMARFRNELAGIVASEPSDGSVPGCETDAR